MSTIKLSCFMCNKSKPSKSDGWFHCKKCPGGWVVCKVCDNYKSLSNMHKLRTHKKPLIKQKKKNPLVDKPPVVKLPVVKPPVVKPSVVKRKKKTSPAQKAKKERKTNKK